MRPREMNVPPCDSPDAAGTLQPHRVVTVLAVTPNEPDRVSLRNLFSRTNWTLPECGDCQETLDFIRLNPVPVILCEQQLEDGDWKHLLSQVRLVSHPPLVIVVSRHADEHLWGEVLNQGAYDLLTKPFDRSELVRVVSLAWRQWKTEWDRNRRTHAGYGSS